MLNAYLGIDPGKSGGIALLASNGDPIACFATPGSDRELWDALSIAVDSRMLGRFGGVHAFIELVHASPQMGVTSAFTFGKGYGALLMALAGMKVPFDRVSPIRWQTALDCRSRGDKNITKRRAQELFPGLKVTHAIADALLLAEYGRRTFGGKHGKEEDPQTQAQIQGQEASGLLNPVRLIPDNFEEYCRQADAWQARQAEEAKSATPPRDGRRKARRP